MSRSMKASLTGVRKSENPFLGKGPKVPLSNTVKTKGKQQNKDISAHRIQRAWLSHLDKTMFQLLKHAICAAEHHVTHEILKKVSPLEAELVKDPCMKCKVRFRFSGEKFPPFIVFKIFLQTEHGYKYFSGKKLLKPSSEAVVDVCKIMGKRKFYHQIMEDEHLFQKFKVTDEIDIVTLKDYMQYSSLLDETPASSGGRNNYWRRLNLENIPRTMIMYDIVDYAETGIISNRLKKEMKYLLQRPKAEEMRQHQLRIVSEVRCPSCFSSLQPLYRPYQQQCQVKHLGRRSKQAQIKVEKMKKAYKKAKEKNASAGTELQKDTASPKQNHPFHPIF
uniref:Chromosome X open reading frame 58 n=1 Tax=Catagonus wagneri TaxID=51154 RepID=A0A8C3VK73_9CETA